MSETALIVIEKSNALTVFTTDDALDPYIAKVQAEVDKFVPDVKTKKGRDDIASMAFKVAKCKTYLESVGKDLAAEQKKIPAKIDAARKAVWDKLEAMQKDVRRPLTEWEAAEEARIARHKDSIAAIMLRANENSDLDAEELRNSIFWAESIDLGAVWEEFESEAGNAKDKALSSLRAALVVREKHEAEQAELVRLRQEAEARAIKDREDAIAREAAELAKREAEEAAARQAKAIAEAAEAERVAVARREQVAKDAANQRELELQLQAQRSENERLEALRREQQAKDDAQRRADEAVAAEKQRAADEAARIAKETAAREKDRSHKAAINKAALEAFIAGGLTAECAKTAVTLIAKKSIPAVTINY